MKTLLCTCLVITYLTSALSANDWPISLDMACNKALSAVACTFEFTNNANEDLYLLKRGTPLEGLFSQFLTVSVAGSPIEYDGIFAHRLPPTKDEFVLLKAGEGISASVQITDAFSIDTDGLYTKWFGAYTRQRAFRVFDVYNRIKGGLAGYAVTYVNGGPYCKPSWYGYTYRGYSTTTVWICNAFYAFPVSCGSPGTYTKEFGLIHEWSHAFGNTFDHVYGFIQSQDLARFYPDTAVDNADNYGWNYCEWQ
uniref:Lysine-specific metallo-endopeptidase domain-containing protein n=1 Tax=Amphimedon queenslandica TaxID=400682 RepID=A0A1X7VGK8_AMPQE